MSQKDWFIETILPFSKDSVLTDLSNSIKNSQIYEAFET